MGVFFLPLSMQHGTVGRFFFFAVIVKGCISSLGIVAVGMLRRGEIMRPAARVLLVLGVVLPFLSSCTTMKYRELYPGEMRLTRMELPEVMAEHLPYDVLIKYESDGEPEIKKVCFRWVADTPSVAHPSLYWYTHEVQADEPIGSARKRWLAEGPYMDISAPFCLDPSAITYDGTDRLIVKFKSGDLKAHYNRLESHAEYVRDGEIKSTNKVSARFVVEK